MRRLTTAAPSSDRRRIAKALSSSRRSRRCGSPMRRTLRPMPKRKSLVSRTSARRPPFGVEVDDLGGARGRTLAAGSQVSLNPLARTQTAAPTLWRAAESSAPRRRRARPFLPTQTAGASTGARHMNDAEKADDVTEAEAFEEFEQCDVAEAGRPGTTPPRPRAGSPQTRQAEVSKSCAGPQSSCRPSAIGAASPGRARDQAQSERGLKSASKSVQSIATTIA